MKNLFRNLLVLTLIACISYSCSKDTNTTGDGNNNSGNGNGNGGEDTDTTSTTKPDALIIKHGWDVPTIRSLQSDKFIEEVNNSPFDGVIFSAKLASREAFSGDSLSQTVIDDEFKDMTPSTFSRPMHNYVRIHVDTIKGGFNTKNINTFANNFKRFAKAAKAAGFEGIAFDNEDYWADPWVWSENASENLACPGLTREECGQSAYNAGRVMMNAILDEWEDVHFMPFFGIWLRNEASWDVIMAHSPGNNWYNANKVEAEFLVGAYSAIHDRKTENPSIKAKFIDGGETYGMRKREDFKAIADHYRTELPATSKHFPDRLRQSYADNVAIAFGIYDFRDGLFGVPTLTPNECKEMIMNGKKEAEYLWFYPELHDWWEHDDNFWPQVYAPDDWRTALSEAIKN